MSSVMDIVKPSAQVDSDGSRALCRQDRHRKSLKRWGSLPTCQLIPSDRRVFVCQRCNLMNVDRDICLPCGNTCNDVSPVQPRRRRISAPNMLNDIQKEQLHFMGRRGTRVAVLRLPQPMMAEGHLTISATIREVDGSSSEEESTSARRRRHRDAIVFSVDGAVASAAKQNVVSDHYVQSVVAHSMMAAFSSSPSSPTSISISESTDPPVEGDSTVTAAFSVPQESLRQLRRKQRISLPKRPSWRSLRKTLSKSSVASPGSDHAQKPQGPPALEVEVLARPASPPIRHKWVPRRPLDRPLYSAIRKNMSPSPPSTPSSSPVHSTFSAASAAHLGGRKSCDTPPSFIRSSDEWVSRPPCYPHTIGTGFSLSGETELRMALARRNTVGGSGSRSQYRYHETKNPSKIKETMMKIGQSLKDLVNMSRRI